MKIEFSEPALDELEEGLDFIAERNPAAAYKIRLALIETLTTFAAVGFEGEIATLSTGELVRRFYKHPFWLYFEREGEVLRVIHVRHHAREPWSH